MDKAKGAVSVKTGSRILALVGLLATQLLVTPARADVTYVLDDDMPTTQVGMLDFVTNPTNLVNGVWSFRYGMSGTDFPMSEVIIADALPFMSNSQNHGFLLIGVYAEG